MTRIAKQAHRNLAAFLGLFLVIHFATHFSALLGLEAHQSVLNAGRQIYQFPLIEIVLVTAFAVQVFLGIALLRMIGKRKRKDGWHWVQFASGCYLAFFVVMHTGAALSTRLLIGLDTNFYWAAGTLTLTPLKYGFAPYYVLAVTALFAHLMAALHFRKPSAWHSRALIAGPVVGVVLVLVYGGAFFPVELPGDHLQYFSEFPGVAPQK